MKDIPAYAKATKRTVEKRQQEGREAYAIVGEATHDVSANDLWDALTNPERLPLWFAKVSGDLRQGGRYQVEGNASGSITRCESPKHFDLTWEFGGDVSWVKVGLAAVGENQTVLRLEHLAIAEGDHWKTYGPGAGGVGWDMALAGLAHYLKTNESIDPEAFFASPAYRELVSFCSHSWGEAAADAGYDQEESMEAAKRTEKFYLGEE